MYYRPLDLRGYDLHHVRVKKEQYRRISKEDVIYSFEINVPGIAENRPSVILVCSLFLSLFLLLLLLLLLVFLNVLLWYLKYDIFNLDVVLVYLLFYAFKNGCVYNLVLVYIFSFEYDFII